MSWLEINQKYWEVICTRYSCGNLNNYVENVTEKAEKDNEVEHTLHNWYISY